MPSAAANTILQRNTKSYRDSPLRTTPSNFPTLTISELHNHSLCDHTDQP